MKSIKTLNIAMSVEFQYLSIAWIFLTNLDVADLLL